MSDAEVKLVMIGFAIVMFFVGASAYTKNSDKRTKTGYKDNNDENELPGCILMVIAAILVVGTIVFPSLLFKFD